jgi:hypothetical protein
MAREAGAPFHAAILIFSVSLTRDRKGETMKNVRFSAAALDPSLRGARRCYSTRNCDGLEPSQLPALH